MTSIASLPPELLLQIFHWSTYDHALFEDLPSWKNYDLTIYDSEDPWPAPSEHPRDTARALALTCTRWAALATEFELRHIVVYDTPQITYYLGRIKNLVQKSGEKEKKAACPIRRITFMVFRERLWTRLDTEAIVSLICSCPNLEVLINENSAEGERHSAGRIILQSLVDSCPKLKRLHWKSAGCMELLPSEWSSILASSSLATSLEALEIDSPPARPAYRSMESSAPTLELPSLHCLRLTVNKDYALLVRAIADEWQLPALTSLYLKSSHRPTVEGVVSLVLAHGKPLTTLAIDLSTSANVPLQVLPPAPIQELVYHGFDLEKTTLIPFTSLSTLVVRLDVDQRESHHLPSVIFAALKSLHSLPNFNLTELKNIFFIERSLDTLREPCPIDAQKLTETQRLWVNQWKKETPRLANRHGVRLFTLVSTDGEQS